MAGDGGTPPAVPKTSPVITSARNPQALSPADAQAAVDKVAAALQEMFGTVWFGERKRFKSRPTITLVADLAALNAAWASVVPAEAEKNLARQKMLDPDGYSAAVKLRGGGAGGEAKLLAIEKGLLSKPFVDEGGIVVGGFYVTGTSDNVDARGDGSAYLRMDKLMTSPTQVSLRSIAHEMAHSYCPRHSDIYLSWLQRTESEVDRLRIHYMIEGMTDRVATPVIDAFVKQTKTKGAFPPTYGGNAEAEADMLVSKIDEEWALSLFLGGVTTKKGEGVSNGVNIIHYKTGKTKPYKW